MKRLAPLLVLAALAAAPAPAIAATCPIYNAPDELVLDSGTPQSAKLGTPFNANLQVSVAASNGCPITAALAGIPVTFVAPSGGPSGTFAASGASSVLVGTDSQGGASATPFTANMLPGGYQVVASSPYGSVSFSLVNTAAGVPASISAVASSARSADVLARYGAPLQVRVLDANGIPVQGASVSFSLGGGDGSGGGGGSNGPGASFTGGQSQATEMTDSNGIATSPALSANEVAGRFTASASVAGVSATADFELDNLAGKPPSIKAAVGAQSANVGARYPKPLKVKVRDGHGKPLQGATVTFALGGSDAAGAAGAAAAATFDGGSPQATEITNAAGIATSPALSANEVAGRFTASASVAGVSATADFELDNLAGKPPSIKAAVGAQSANVGARYPKPLKVKVRDGHGKPLQGATVTFALGGSDAAGAAGAAAAATFDGGSPQATEITNAAGIATSPALSANEVAGRFTASASVAGVSATADFELDNLAGKPPSIKAAVGAQSANVGARYPKPLKVKVRDGHGKPLQGATVTFALGGSDAAGAAGAAAAATFDGGSPQATEITNAAGIAASPGFVANSTPGTFTATATVTGATAAAGFALDNRAAGSPSLKAVGGGGQSTTVGKRFGKPLSVRLRDAHGKPLQAQTVTFAVGGAGTGGASGDAAAGASFAGGSTQATETTNAAGIATSPRLVANGTAGSLSANATVAGMNGSASFTLRNLAGAAHTVLAGAGSSDSAAEGSRFSIPLAVTVTDKDGNAVAGAVVRFAGPAGGAGGTFRGKHAVEVKTNAAGIAVAPPFVANRHAGGYVVKATVAGAGAAGFGLVNLP